MCAYVCQERIHGTPGVIPACICDNRHFLGKKCSKGGMCTKLYYIYGQFFIHIFVCYNIQKGWNDQLTNKNISSVTYSVAEGGKLHPS